MRTKVRRKGHLRRKGTQYHYVREHGMFTSKQRKVIAIGLTAGIIGLSAGAMYRMFR
jgi:hypothetical protein